MEYHFHGYLNTASLSKVATMLCGQPLRSHVVFTRRAEGIYDYCELITISNTMLDIARDVESIALPAEARFVADSQCRFTLYYNPRLLVRMAMSG